MNTLKSIFRGICEVLQFISLLVLSVVTLIVCGKLFGELLSACGVQPANIPMSLLEKLFYLAPVMAGLLYWRSRKEYWEMCKSSADQNKNTNQ